MWTMRGSAHQALSHEIQYRHRSLSFPSLCAVSLPSFVSPNPRSSKKSGIVLFSDEAESWSHLQNSYWVDFHMVQLSMKVSDCPTISSTTVSLLAWRYRFLIGHPSINADPVMWHRPCHSYIFVIHTTSLGGWQHNDVSVRAINILWASFLM